MSILTECRDKRRRKDVRARRRKLTQAHKDILDWLMCIEDNIVLGDDEEATDFIKQLNAYTEKLAILLGERQLRRLSKSKTTKNTEHES